MRGRKPKPLERHAAEGDTRKVGKRKLQQSIDALPKAARGLPPCPKHLKGRARAAWNFWSEELRSMKLDRRPDAQMLEGACVAYDRAVQADLLVAEEGLIITEQSVSKTRKGEGPNAEETTTVTARKRTHAAVGISHKSWTLVRSFCSEFGLSPVSRTRLQIEKDIDDDAELYALLDAEREYKSPQPTTIQ